MNSINGFGSLGSLCNVSNCNKFAVAHPQAENSLPEQHDMVSLGQGAPELESSFRGLVGTEHSAAQVSESVSVATSEKASASVANNSVDAGNGLRATMSNLGVLTLLDDPAIESLNQTSEVSTSSVAERQNTLAVVNLNNMESILTNGLIAM